MKKAIVMMLVAVMCVATASARERISRNIGDLPQPAQTFLKKHFKADISHIKVETGTFGGVKEYEVILNNGSEVEFDFQGAWTDVDCGYNAVPDGIVLKPMKDYVNRNFKGCKIVRISKERNKYEVELSNGQEMEFDRAGKFLRLDD